MLGQHAVFRNVIYTNWLESAVADVQSYFRHTNADFFDFSKRFRREMQPGRRRGNRSAFTRIDGLITLAVCVDVTIRPLYVGRQRRFAQFVDQNIQITVGFKFDDYLASRRLFYNVGN